MESQDKTVVGTVGDVTVADEDRDLQREAKGVLFVYITMSLYYHVISVLC